MNTVDEQIGQRTAFSTRHWRSTVDEDIRHGGQNLWNRARQFIKLITNRYVNSDTSIDVFEIDIHDLWYLFIETAKITPANEATADRLVNQVLYARELGHVSRIAAPSNGGSDDKNPDEQQTLQVESATTSSSARMWTDLPFLTTDLQAAWTGSMMQLPMVERENLAGFTARLAALGVCHPHLNVCAIALFREALETPRRLLEGDAVVNDANELPLTDFLPAISAWILYDGYKILTLCAQEQTFPEDIHNGNEEWASAGPLFAAGEEEHRLQPGFNMPRWQFWKDRLEEISRGTEDADTAEQGRKCAHIMESWEQVTGGRKHDRETARATYFNH